MSVNEYNSVVSQLQNSRERRKRGELLQEEEIKKRYEEVNAEEEKRERIEKEELIDATCSPVEVLAPDSDPVAVTSEIQRQANDREQDKELEEKYAIDKEEGDYSEWDREIEDGYSEEILRYLVHNTTPHGVRFFLTALRSGTTITEFSQSRLCRVMFGEVHLSILQCIYRHRQYLTSYYRLRRYHPYPEKEMIHSCVACAATARGNCSCNQSPFMYFVDKSAQVTGTVRSVFPLIVDRRMPVLTSFTARYAMSGMWHPANTIHTRP